MDKFFDQIFLFFCLCEYLPKTHRHVPVMPCLKVEYSQSISNRFGDVFQLI